MKEIKTKEDVFNSICNASSLGMLGLFVGAGFSKAIMELSGEKAFSWGELLSECCSRLNVDQNIMESFGSYPEIATKICKQNAINKEITYKESVQQLKEAICQLATMFPDSDLQIKYEIIFDQLSVNWIATTNYDTILESILNGKAFPIEPDACFTKIKHLVPVYHIHGICKNPSSIVITNEDYAYLFRPNDYRQARLPFLMKESLVLMVGYGLGDINVLTAVDWSKNVYTNSNDEYDFPIIQLLHKAFPAENPYQDESGIIILEIDDLDVFFSELNEYADKYKSKNEKLIERVNKYISEFTESASERVMNYINNKNLYRTNVNNFIASLPRELGYVYTSFMSFLRHVIIKLNEMSVPYGAFSAYNKKLNIILDAYSYIPLSRMPTPFFETLANEFNAVSYYVGIETGKSWDAAETWEKRKSEIPQETVNELWRIARSDRYQYADMRKLLFSLKKEHKDGQHR